MTVAAWYISRYINTKNGAKYHWIPIDPVDYVGSAVLPARRNQPSYADLHKHYGRNK